VIVTERKRHPNDVRYPCRGSHEVLDAGRKLMTFLNNDDPVQLDQLRDGQLILDEEETAELFDSIKKEDVIGLGTFRQTGHPNAGFTSNMYTVEEVHPDEDYLECRNMRSEEIEEITFQDVSVALALGLAEILYRGDKPFGITNDIEWKISVQEKEEEEEDSTSPNATSATPATQTEASDVLEEEDTLSDMFGDLGVPSLTAKESEPLKPKILSEEELKAAFAEKMDTKFLSKGMRLSYLRVQKLKEGEVIWVHATTNLGAVTAKGPLFLRSIEKSLYTFISATEVEHVIDIVDGFDDYAGHFLSNGGFYNLFEARDSRPKPESAASANDDSDKLIEAMGLNKKAKKAETESSEPSLPPVRWPDCYFAFGYLNDTYSLVVCPKDHWDEHQALDDGTRVKQIADQVGIQERLPGVFEYAESHSESDLRMLFKAFGCVENKNMVDDL